MPTPENPIILEHPEGPTFSEKFQQQTGVQPTPISVKPVYDPKGNPITNTSNPQSVKINVTQDKKTLIAWSKGSVTKALTWLGKFLLRALKKQDTNATNN